MPNHDQKILFICLDGADRDLILQWANEGLLPNVKALLQTSIVGKTQDPPGINGCHWPTFFSGKSPSQHGRYWSQQIQLGSYEIKPYQFKYKPFWENLSEAGYRVTLIDPPEASLSKIPNSIEIIEKPKGDQALSFQSHPAALDQEIEQKFGRTPFGSLRSTGRSLGDIEKFRENLITSIDQKTKVIQYFLDKNDWDVMLTSFRESHWVGHQCWHILDPKHPEYDEDIAKTLGNPIKDIYIHIDNALGQILQKVGTSATTFIYASTSMGANYTGIHILDEVLLRLENPERAGKTKVLDTALARLKQYKLLRQIKKKFIKPFKQSTKPRKQSKENSNRSYRKAFQVPSSEAFGGIRVNLEGREPQGRIALGHEYEKFCQDLAHDLSQLINLDTGEPVIKNIFFSKDIFKKDLLTSSCPDLLVEWNRSAPINSIHSPKTGKISKIYWDSRTGDHRAGGIFFVSSPQFMPMELKQSTSILDFAPTLASFFGLQIPESDGISFLPFLTKSS